MGKRIAKKVTNKNVTTGDKFVTTYYVRDPQGNVLAVYEHKHGDSDNGTFTLAEQHLYGAGRLGMRKRDLALNATNANESPATYYELTNHLGNVMAVISDKASTTAEPTVVSLSDYYPFGMTEPGRSYSAGDYRYGFNGKEKEDELYDFGARMYNAKIGVFLSLDPLKEKFPYISNYSFANNSPIMFVDYEGEDPNVAIILTSPNDDLHNYYPERDFNDHKEALESEGYTVIYALTGQEMLEYLIENSQNGEIENLIILSHAYPKGCSSYDGRGFYTKEATDTKDRCIYVSDMAEAKERGELKVSPKLRIVIGGCNSAGHVNSKEDEKITEFFISSLAKAMGDETTVYGARGYSSPDYTSEAYENWSMKYKERRKNDKNFDPNKPATKYRKAGWWEKATSDGEKIPINNNNNTIDLANPEKNIVPPKKTNKSK